MNKRRNEDLYTRIDPGSRRFGLIGLAILLTPWFLIAALVWAALRVLA